MSLLDQQSLTPRLVRNRLSLFNSYRRGEATLEGFPIELNVEVTGICNVDCIMCPQETMERSKGMMSMEVFKNIINQAKDYVEVVLLHIAGDPLLHPKLFEMIAYCRENKVKTLVSTNCVALDERRSRAMLKDPPDILILSFDGTSKEVYEKIRRRAHFEPTRENIKRFLQMKRSKRILPYTMLQLIYMKENQHQVNDFLKEWRVSSANEIRIKPYFDYPAVREYHGVGQRRPEPATKPCLYLWRQMAITWDGTVTACCLDMTGQLKMGDVNHQSLREVWNAEEFVNARKLHVQGRYKELAPCATCTMPQVGTPLLAGTVLLDSLSIKKILPKIEKMALLWKIKRLNYMG